MYVPPNCWRKTCCLFGKFLNLADVLIPAHNLSQKDKCMCHQIVGERHVVFLASS